MMLRLPSVSDSLRGGRFIVLSRFNHEACMVEASHDDRVTTRLILDETAWDDIRGDWDGLFAASPSASTPLDFGWLRSWWRLYGPVYGLGGLRIITAWRESKLVGALPLYEHRGVGGSLGIRSLRFISTGEAEEEETCPDYMNLLHIPGEEAACAEIFWKEISLMAWDYLEFLDLPDTSPLIGPHERALGAGSAEVLQRGACPIADLGQGFEAYVQSLSAKTRQHARQYVRAADRDGAVLELASGPDVDLFFDDLIRLHQERWTADGKPGCFAAARFTDFHRALAREWVPSGRAVLARLSHGGTVYGVLYGFITRSKFDFYQSGIWRGTDGPLPSPGTLAHLLLMRALAERGVTAYDFLRGSSSYKQRLSTQESRLAGIRAWRPTPRAAALRAMQLAGRAIRKGKRLVRGN
jgi:hypothetical protein